MNQLRLDTAVTMFFVAAVFVSGCGKPPTIEEETASRLEIVATMYSKFSYDHQGVRPFSEAELKQFITDRNQAILDGAGIASVDELFVSERDNQPLVVLFGKNTITKDYMEIVVHEATGVDGKIMVGYSSGETELIDASSLKE